MNEEIKNVILNDERLARKLHAIVNMCRFDDLESQAVNGSLWLSCLVETVSIGDKIIQTNDLIDLFHDTGLDTEYNKQSYGAWYDQVEARLDAEYQAQQIA